MFGHHSAGNRIEASLANRSRGDVVAGKDIGSEFLKQGQILVLALNVAHELVVDRRQLRTEPADIKRVGRQISTHPHLPKHPEKFLGFAKCEDRNCDGGATGKCFADGDGQAFLLLGA